MSEARATVTRRRRISTIWLVPIVALVLGSWMVIHTLRSQGPEITIHFASAAGIEADKTKIKVRSVVIGVVEDVRLTEDYDGIVITSRLDKVAEPLLREDTQFWVVRPRVGAEGISGLGTLLSGAFIQLAPGTGKQGRRHFVGLDVPPVTPAGTPGLTLHLISDRAGSVGPGDPILYKGFRVGRIESARFDPEAENMHYGAFIDAPYDDLVTSTTRFWNASGISMSATADGIEVELASLQALLTGGVVFSVPEGMERGQPVEAGETFVLYRNKAVMEEKPYRHSIEYVVEFSRSVRGLEPGAPVEYRGLPVGRVEHVLLDELAHELGGKTNPIPVLLRLEPGRIGLPDTEASLLEVQRGVTDAVARGMRATLATGSLLTGKLYVSLAMFPDEPPAAIGTFAGRPTIPTVSGGLAAIEQRVTALLDKLNALPLDTLLDRVDRILVDFDRMLASKSVQELPRSLESALAELQEVLESISADSALQERLLRTTTELNRTLQSLRAFLETLRQKPNSLIFSRDVPADAEPPAGAP